MIVFRIIVDDLIEEISSLLIVVETKHGDILKGSFAVSHIRKKTRMDMNRGDGLVRRNVARDNPSTSGTENHVDDDRVDRDDSLEDGDSNETRLTLMEEVLLLGLKDKEVVMPLDHFIMIIRVFEALYRTLFLKNLFYVFRVTLRFGTIVYHLVCVAVF